MDRSVVAQQVDGGGDVDRVPADHSVGDQVEAERLIGLILGSPVADLGLVGEEDEPAEGVEGLAFAELALDTAPVGLVLEVGEQEPGLGGPSEFLDGAGQSRLLRTKSSERKHESAPDWAANFPELHRRGSRDRREDRSHATGV